MKVFDVEADLFVVVFYLQKKYSTIELEYLDLPLHSVSLNITETGKLSIEQWDFIDSEMLITLFLKNQNKKIMY